LNLRSNFTFNAIWHRRSVVVLTSCWRPAESDLMSHHHSCVWIKCTGDRTMQLIYFHL